MQKPDEISMKEIQFSPNMQWVLNIFKPEEYKEPILRSLTMKDKWFKLPGITRKRKEPRIENGLIKETIELSPIDNKRKLECEKKFVENL